MVNSEDDIYYCIDYEYDGFDKKYSSGDNSYDNKTYIYNGLRLVATFIGDYYTYNAYATTQFYSKSTDYQEPASVKYFYDNKGDMVKQNVKINNETPKLYCYEFDTLGNMIWMPSGVYENYDAGGLYKGYEYNANTGLYSCGARYYDPSTGRFTSQDTYAGQQSDPLSLNLYSYSLNNPIKYYDPTGHEAEEYHDPDWYRYWDDYDWFCKQLGVTGLSPLSQAKYEHEGIFDTATGEMRYLLQPAGARGYMSSYMVSSWLFTNNKEDIAKYFADSTFLFVRATPEYISGTNERYTGEGTGEAGTGATGKGDLYQYEVGLITQINSIETNKFGWDLNNIKKIYEKNKAIYEEISRLTGIPPELICAIHYRESGCDFNTYLHNGQPLGKPTTIVPVGRLFNDFKEAAVDALLSFKSLRDEYGITSDSSDMAALMGFAESYNGTGYKDNNHGPSPYVYSGTNIYKSGKYVSDGKYSATAIDGQPGVYILVNELKNS